MTGLANKVENKAQERMMGCEGAQQGRQIFNYSFYFDNLSNLEHAADLLLLEAVVALHQPLLQPVGMRHPRDRIGHLQPTKR